MALTSTLTTVIYNGNGSTSTPYVVPFARMTNDDVKVRVTAAGTGTVAVAAGVATFSSAQSTLIIGSKVRIGSTIYEIATRTSDTVFGFKDRPTISASAFHILGTDALGSGDFTLTGSTEAGGLITGGSITTTAAVPSTSLVTIFRSTPATQPAVLPGAGAMPTETLEQMADRQTMVAQEVISRISGDGVGLPGQSGGALLEDTAVFADSAARTAAVPKRVGQLGVQIDTQKIYIASGVSAGAWVEYAPVSTAAVSPKRLTVAVWSDAGTPGAAQNALISTVNSWSPDVKIACGDNTYAPATYAAAHAAFGSLLAQLEIHGNHDEAFWLNHEVSFSHIPVNHEGHRRYWNVRYGNLFSVYGLHSGLDSAGNMIEPDGNTVGSTQHDWFVSQLATDECRWKIAAFHHPPFTPSDESNRVCVAMDWPELKQMSAIFTGHDHIPWKGTFRGVPMFAVSGGVISDGTVHPYGALAGLGSVSGVDAILDGRQIVGKIDISTERFVVSYHDIWTGQMLRQFDLGAEWRVNEWGQEVLDPDSPLTTGWKFVGICPARYKLDAWYIGTKTVAGEVTGKIYVGETSSSGFEAASFTIPDGSNGVTVPSILAGTPRGAYAQVYITSAAGYPDRTGLQVNMLGRQLTTV